MNKKWDVSRIAYNVDMWKQCFRILKPGGYLLSFGGTRTYHRMACAIEDAGFEIRDMVEWIYNSGFPKSLNIGKKIDEKFGNKRRVVEKIFPDGSKPRRTAKHFIGEEYRKNIYTKGNSKWEGYGTAIKPAHEPICMARKLISEKTIVDNVLKWGTGGINIDGCRIPYENENDIIPQIRNNKRNVNAGNMYRGNSLLKSKTKAIIGGDKSGRFPANIICQDDALNDGTISKGQQGAVKGNEPSSMKQGNVYGDYSGYGKECQPRGDIGSNSRYFDIDIWARKNGLLQFPKASKSEKNRGCEKMNIPEYRWNSGGEMKQIKNQKGNFHPTVKNLALMSYLITLVSKQGDIILDPFAGSGTTLVAAKQLRRKYIGIEMTEEYIPIIKARLKNIQEILI